MKLYTNRLSPFGARAKLVLAHKDSTIEIVEPPGGPATDEFKGISANGKIPVLIIDGTVLPESLSIAEYLNETLAGTNLMPNSALDKARVRTLCQLFSFDCFAPVFPLFGELMAESVNQDIIDAQVSDIKQRIGLFENYLSGDDFLVGDQVTIADCALAPVAFMLDNLPMVFGKSVDYSASPKYAAWWSKIQKESKFEPTLADMNAALQAFAQAFGKG